MKEHQSFVVIDIESTGVPGDVNAEILEVAMMYGDYGRSGPCLEHRVHFFIEKDHDSLVWSEGARNVLSDYEERYNKGDIPVLTKEDALQAMRDFLSRAIKANNDVRPMLVGKGLFSFLIPMLRNENFTIDDLVDYNGLDFISAFYFEVSGRCSVNKVCKALGVPLYGKTVVDDCVKILSCFYELCAQREKVSSSSWY